MQKCEYILQKNKYIKINCHGLLLATNQTNEHSNQQVLQSTFKTTFMNDASKYIKMLKSQRGKHVFR